MLIKYINLLCVFVVLNRRNARVQKEPGPVWATEEKSSCEEDRTLIESTLSGYMFSGEMAGETLLSSVPPAISPENITNLPHHQPE